MIHPERGQELPDKANRCPRNSHLGLLQIMANGEVYHRKQSPSQTPSVAAEQQRSGEIWGSRNRAVSGGESPFLSVDAYVGPLGKGEKGIEFTTDVPPDGKTPPNQARWTGPRDGVIVEGEYAKIKVKVTRNTQDGAQ
jgi:hypothetical protein